MNQKAHIMLKALLAHSEHKEELFHFLSPDLMKEMEGISTPPVFNPKALFSSTGWIQPIHFSWLALAIREYPQALQPLFIDLLGRHQLKGVSEMLTSCAKKTSPFLRSYLAYVLRSELLEPDLINESHLPFSALNVLLQLGRKDLIHLCDLLGIHDLAVDLRQVVDKKLLKEIYNVLTPEQLQFLHYCSKQPIRWISPKLGLHSWDYTAKQLNKLLHFRGLIRLGKTIARENDSFKWHVLHRFDTGRAKIIQKEFYKKQDSSLSTYFKNQVLHIAKSGIYKMDAQS